MVEKDDLFGALSMLKSAEKIKSSLQTTVRIADVYADMGLLDISNRYWYRFMHTAPKEKVSMAFEELGINYFYMENLWATGYYFHKKIETDGFISKEGIDNEIIEFLSGDEFKKHAYRIVYPPEKADYSLEAKSGKRALALGAFSEAVLMLEHIPVASRTLENSDDLTVAYFMSDDLENAEKESRRALKAYGESVGIYCNLATIFELKKDSENSEYYYQKALNLVTGERVEAYKLMTCAIERKDHVMIKECLEKVIEERPYEIAMIFFKGIAHVNVHEYAEAEKWFKKAYALDTEDLIIEYFYNLAKQLNKGDGEEKLLPLAYEKSLPKKIESRWSARIRYLINQPQKFIASTKNKDTLKLFKWCLFYGSDSLMRSLCYNLASLVPKVFYKLALQLLMSVEGGETQKRLMIYLLAMSGYKGRVGVVFGVFYKSYNAKKVACEKELDNPKFLTAYALTMSKLVLSEIEDIDKIALACDRVYSVLKDKISEETTVEELSALMIDDCAFKNHTDLNNTCKQLHCDANKVIKLKEKLKKESKND